MDPEKACAEEKPHHPELNDQSLEPEVSSAPSSQRRSTGYTPEAGLESGLNTAAPNIQEEDKWVHGSQMVNIMAALTLVCFLVLLDASIIVTALPRITNDFHSLADIGWYGAAYQLSSACFQPIEGKIYALSTPKWVFLTFFTIFKIGSLVCALATSSNMLIGGRVVAGVGMAGLLNGILVIIAECAPLPKRPTLIGINMGIGQLGLVGGPLIGGLFTQFVTWRWCFYINLPIGGLVAAMLVFVHVPQQHSRPGARSIFHGFFSHFDMLGFVTLAGASTMLLLALQWGRDTFSWDSSQIIGLFCGAGVAFIVFALWIMRKGDAAIFPFSMVRKRVVWIGCVVYGLCSGHLYTESYWVPVYFQGARGASPALSGVYILPMIVAHILCALSSGPLLKRVGYWIPISVFGAVMIAVGSGLVSTFTPTTSTGKWIGYQIILGVGRGIGLQMPLIAVQHSVPPAQIPVAMAFVMFGQSFGAAVCLGLAETIYSNSFRTLIPKDAPGVDVQSIIVAGATGFRAIVPQSSLAGVLDADSQRIDRVFYLVAGLGVGIFAFSWGLGWKNLKKK